MAVLNMSSDENAILINPATPEEQKVRLLGMLTAVPSGLRSHYFLLTSGTSSGTGKPQKWVALSKSALQVSADAVNHHLQSGSSDIWLQCLPEFHIGGLSILTRADRSGARVVQMELNGKWNARIFCAQATAAQATLCSLVPAQIYDIVHLNLPAPPDLRAVLVGGGALSLPLYHRARELGWRLLPTYGMTETASQVATAPLTSLDASPCGLLPTLRILPHLQVRASEDGAFEISGPSLLSGYIIARNGDGSAQFMDPRQKGWFTTEDHGLVREGCLEVQGRSQDRIKIGGETTHLLTLNAVLDEVRSSLRLQPDVALVASPDGRLENVITLIHEEMPGPLTDSVIEAFNAKVLPFEKIRRSQQVERIPRTELGKLKLSLLSPLP